jgi:hypothetical protein
MLVSLFKPAVKKQQPGRAYAAKHPSDGNMKAASPALAGRKSIATIRMFNKS